MVFPGVGTCETGGAGAPMRDSSGNVITHRGCFALNNAVDHQHSRPETKQPMKNANPANFSGFAQYHRVKFTANHGVDNNYVQQNLVSQDTTTSSSAVPAKEPAGAKPGSGAGGASSKGGAAAGGSAAVSQPAARTSFENVAPTTGAPSTNMSAVKNTPSAGTEQSKENSTSTSAARPTSSSNGTNKKETAAGSQTQNNVKPPGFRAPSVKTSSERIFGTDQTQKFSSSRNVVATSNVGPQKNDANKSIFTSNTIKAQPAPLKLKRNNSNESIASSVCTSVAPSDSYSVAAGTGVVMGMSMPGNRGKIGGNKPRPAPWEVTADVHRVAPVRHR